MAGSFYFYAVMTKDQAFQLGEALIAWSKGADLKARDTLNVDKCWYPFLPNIYMKIAVKEGIEWRVVDHSFQQPSSASIRGEQN